MTQQDRRRFLKSGGGLLLGAALGVPGLGRAAYQGSAYQGSVVELARGSIGYPFTLGVASGDPLPDSVVLWTRLAPSPLETGGGMPQQAVMLRWEIAADERFRRSVLKGWAVAAPHDAHAVHVEVDGLAPGRDYWYRFIVAGEASAIGHTRTAPAPGQHQSRLRCAFASCQDYEDGLYTAYGHMAGEDLDLVVFLGDYIYEGAPSSSAAKVRQHAGDGETVTLEQYRQRYAQYKTDADLQAAHAAFPWMVTLDDHEVDNDWSAYIPQDPELQSTEAFLRRRAAAFQAYYEHMPLRAWSRPRGPTMRLYRRLGFGNLAEFNVLDTRQYRSLTEPCGYGTGPACDAVYDPERTMLGDRQEAWLYAGLRRSQARWNVLAQQVPVTRIDVGAGEQQELKLDKWDAYPVARQRLFDFIAAQRPSNPVVISGDLHDAWVAHLKQDFDDPDSETLASEFVGTSISSDGDGAESSEDGINAFANGRNPHLLFHNYRRGYVSCELTQDQWLAHFRVVDFVEQPGAPLRTEASFAVEDGNPETYAV